MTGWAGTAAAQVDAIAAAVLRCPAVAGLHSGPWAATVTLLPGRRIEGVRLTGDRLQIGVVAAHGVPVALLTDQVRTAVAALAPGVPVDVHVGDLQLPQDRQPALPAGPGG